jgi:hypothetical protein
MKTDKKETVFLLLWFLGFVSVYVLFRPIKGDQFFHFPFVYGYLLSSILLVWSFYLISNPFKAAFAAKVTTAAVFTAVMFAAGSYLYNGRGQIIRNAAEYNYPLILKTVLDETNQEELDLAVYFARAGKNPEIVEYLKQKGAK